MSDIVERLRNFDYRDDLMVVHEAADKIELLRRILNDYRIANDKAADEIERMHEQLKRLQDEKQ